MKYTLARMPDGTSVALTREEWAKVPPALLQNDGEVRVVEADWYVLNMARQERDAVEVLGDKIISRLRQRGF